MPAPRKRRAQASRHFPSPQRGSALLAVLWLSAALAAIAFTLSTTVRGETERESTSVDGLRSYYLASGAIERATLELLWSVYLPPDRRPIPRGATFVDYHFPSGDARVEILPETGKLDLNTARPEVFYRLLMALGVESDRAREIALGIEDWRRPGPPNSPFDAYYLSLNPSFHSPHASFQEIEELLLVKGVTPDIFYGTWVPQPEPGNGPRLVPRAGLADCVTVFGSGNQVDANTAQPAVLQAIGLSPFAIHALVQRRNAKPFTIQDLGPFLQSVGAQTPGYALRVEGNSIVTLRATARLRLQNGQLSDLRRSVAAQVKYLPDGFDSPFHFLRWYDTAWSY